jgi:hypothetical protein
MFLPKAGFIGLEANSNKTIRKTQIRARRLIHVALCVFLFEACAPKKVILPTPLGPLEIEFEKELEKYVPNSSDLSALKPIESKTERMPIVYRPQSDLEFAIWVLPECANPEEEGDRSFHVYHSPESTILQDYYLQIAGKETDAVTKFRTALKKLNSELINEFDEITSANWSQNHVANSRIELAAIKVLRDSQSVRYVCRNEYEEVELTADSRINGWQLPANIYSGLKEDGKAKLTIPKRLIVITAVPKDQIFGSSGVDATPANLMLWTRTFDIAYNVDSLYGDNEKGFLYIGYRLSYHNVSLHTGQDKRSLGSFVGNGVRGYFTGRKFLYIVDIFQKQGYQTLQIEELKKSLHTFRFVKEPDTPPNT